MSDKSSTGSAQSQPLNAQQRFGRQLGGENIDPDPLLDPKIRQSPAFKKAQEAYGPSAHEVQWGPDALNIYTELNNPFYYRTPKNMIDPPAHVPQNPMVLELHLREERQRTSGMTNAEREWRKKYVQSQVLHPDEPFHVPEAVMFLNPFRRIYRWPLDTLGRKFLYPKFGLKTGAKIRHKIPKVLFTFLGIEIFYYYSKYTHETWWDPRRPSFYSQKPFLSTRDEIEALHPGLIEKAYPSKVNAEDYYDLGFKDRAIFLNLGETKRPW